MLPASNRGAGMSIGFPDVCLTPAVPAPVPVPYPNFAMNVMAAPFSPIVKVSGMPALNLASMIPMTTGDEGGLAHPTIKGMGRYTMGNPIVKVDGLPAINLLCPTTGNNMNNPLGAVLVPSVTNVFYCDAGVAAPASPAGESLAELGEALDGGGLSGAPRSVRGVVIVAVARFTPALPSAVHRALAAAHRAGAVAAVLDLRGCPGGDLDAAVRLAGDFLPEGAVVARGVDADGDPLALEARGGPSNPWHVAPLALLVDGGTASAAEVFAGALGHHGRAALCGARTFGKGAARIVRPGPAGARYGTAVTFTRPDGTAFEGRGLEPDRVVAPGEDAVAVAVAVARGDDPLPCGGAPAEASS